MHQITAIPVAVLVPYVHNARTHSEAQVAQIAASIKEFGFTNPVLVDEHNGIIAGEGRVLAARKLRLETVPCIVLSGLTEAQKTAYVIADNKIALNSGWNDGVLQGELETLAGMSFDLNLTGFDDVTIADLLASIEIGDDNDDSDADKPETTTPAAPKTKTPDEWQGMPEFDQPEAGPYRTIYVHFRDQADVDAFAGLVGQKLTDKTKFVWYPEAKRAEQVVVYG